MKARKLDVLIATNGRAELLESALNSLLLAVPYGYIEKIVVVENGTKEGAADICSRLAEKGPIEYHWYQEANKSMALNYGLNYCSEGLIFMTDDDIIISPEVIAAYATQTVEWKNKAFFGGATDACYETEPAAWVKRFLPASARGWSSTREAMQQSGFFIGFNWAAFKSDLIEAGGFNPDFGPGGRTGATGQESEMQRRLRDIGATAIYLEGISVTHQVPNERCNLDWLLKRSYRQGVEKGIVQARLDLESAKSSLASDKRHNVLLKLKGILLFSPQIKFKQRFYAERMKGYEKALELHLKGELSEKPYTPINPLT